MNELTNHPRYREARCHVKELKGFYVHAAVYACVNLGLFVLGHLAGRGTNFFPWATMAWGIGLFAHGMVVFAFRGWFGSGWEERKIREYLERGDATERRP